MYESLNIDDICKYHDSNSYTIAIPTNCSDYFNVLHINARSLNKNYDLMMFLMKSLPKLPDGYISHHVHRPDGSIGRGVAIYVKMELQSTIIN